VIKILLSAALALGSTQPLTEMSTSVECRNTTSLEKETEYIYRFSRKAIEIRFHFRNFNRDGRFSLGLFCNPATDVIKQLKICITCSPSPTTSHLVALSFNHGPRNDMQLRRFRSNVVSGNITGLNSATVSPL
jgi:hypothetical protein